MIFVLNSGVYFFFGMILSSIFCMYLIYHTRLFFQSLIQSLVSIILLIFSIKFIYYKLIAFSPHSSSRSR